MTGWMRVATFVVASLACGFFLAEFGDRADWDPLVAPAGAALVAALYGHSRRGRDLVEVIGPSLLIAYAAFAGVAISRMGHPNVIAAQWMFDPMIDRLPVVLLGGVAYALVVTVFLALPASKLARWHCRASERDDRFWTFVHERASAQKRDA
jgi:hypothetical protein